jgi:TonB family protein
MMLAPDLTTTPALVTAQRTKEGKAIRTFLLWSLLGSAAFHAIAMAAAPTAFWNSLPEATEETIEVVAEPETPIEPEKPVEQKVETTPPEAASEVSFAPPPPLAPDTQAPQAKGEDAPSNQPPSRSPEVVNPITSKTGEDSGLRVGGGPIFSPFGTGFGFGNASRPTGFNPLGQPDGNPKGTPGGTPGGVPGGTATRTTAPPVPTPKPNQPACISCPKPKYRGSEGSPRVDLTVRPDGSVEVRLRKSSGNPETDRETLETMSKWRFDPKTIPEGGIKKRVRVEYEEEGSTRQRQNEERRRQEAERQQIAEQERQRREAQERQRQQPQQAIETPAKPAPTPAPAEAPAPAEKPAAPPDPVPAPAVEAPPPPEPAPSEVAPPPPDPVPAPAVESPPASSSN